MIIATLQVMGSLKPELSVHGDIVKIDLGLLLLEMNKETFITTVDSLIFQASKFEVYIRT